MKSTLHELGQVERDKVIRYLDGVGIPPRLATWKYFDESFNRGRNRGYVGLRDGAVCGFLGVIPFEFHDSGETSTAVWTCDWYADAGQDPTLGLRLLAAAGSDPVHVMHIGGNEVTRRILNRLARSTIENGAVQFRLTLRAGDLFDRAWRRAGHKPKSVPLLGRIPLRRSLALDSEGVRVEDGAAPVIEKALHAWQPGPRFPEYDMGYVRWQTEACPDLSAFTSWIEVGDALAAGLFWTSRKSESWRVAFWGPGASRAQMAAVLLAGIRQVQLRKGSSVSALISVSDEMRAETLRELGFASHREIPFDLIRTKLSGFAIDRVNGLSFLDCDLAYLF